MSDQIWYGDIDNIRELFNVTYENGIKFERERIIKLLESDIDVLPEFARAIELIKGEQK